MAALLPFYLLLAALHITGAFGLSLSPGGGFIYHRYDPEELHLDPIWDSDIVQYIRRFHSRNPPELSRSKFLENLKYNPLFTAGWAVQKPRDSSQASKASVTTPGFREGLPTENIRLDAVIRSKANERSGHPGLKQSVDATQQGVTKREPIEMTKENLDSAENSTTVESTEEIGHPDSTDTSERVRSEKEGEREPMTEETSTTDAATDNSGSEERTTDIDHDEVAETTIPTTTTVIMTTSSVPSTADSEHSTVHGSSSKGMSPKMTSISTTTVTGSETTSSIISTAELKYSTTDGSSSNGISTSTTHIPSTSVTVSETASSILSTEYSKSSTVDGGSSSKISSSTTHFPTTTVTVSPTPSTETEGTTTELVINMPKIRAAKIIISSVLLAIGLVAVAVMAVCIFRERRRKVKYDQLKLLP